MKTSSYIKITSLCLTLAGFSLSLEAHAKGGHQHQSQSSSPTRRQAKAPSRSVTSTSIRQSTQRRAATAPSRSTVAAPSRSTVAAPSRSTVAAPSRKSTHQVTRTTRKVTRHVERHSHKSHQHNTHRHGRPFRAIPIARPVARPHHHGHHHTRYCGHERSYIFNELYNDPIYFGVNNDFSDEERKIDLGILDGRITPREARRLKTMLWDARALEQDALYDGLLTHEEEADLYWAERELNREIRWELNDFEQW